METWFVSDRLRREIDVEKELLRKLLDTHRPLFDVIVVREPSSIEISALAAMLHSFFTGIENVLKRIALHLDGGVPAGQAWHSRLLECMAEPTGQRAAVISIALRDTLRGYLAFRHMFRHAYSFDIHWSRMAPLVKACDHTLRRFEEELDAFVRSLPSSSN